MKKSVGGGGRGLLDSEQKSRQGDSVRDRSERKENYNNMNLSLNAIN